MDQNLYFQRGIQIITKINEITPQAYLIGGVVRDYLLKLPFNDIDIATTATPEQLMAIFPNASDEYLEYGCITLKEDDMIFEITTFRDEVYNGKSRTPSEIHFSKKLADDVQRRDFTVNALAIPKSKVLVDLVGGEKDIKNKIVRCIGKPKKRFKEDPLRILRGLSLVAKANFSIESKTLHGMISCKKHLGEISTYKLSGEIANILNLPYGKKAVKIINKYKLFAYDRLLNRWFSIIAKKYDKLTTLEKFILLFKMAGKVPDNTCFTKETIAKINVINNLSKYLELNNVKPYDVYKNSLDELITADLINTFIVKKYKSQIKEINKINQALPIKTREDINFRPRNIIDLVGTPGEYVSKIMDEIEKLIVSKELENDYDQILLKAKSLLSVYDINSGNKEESTENDTSFNEEIIEEKTDVSDINENIPEKELPNEDIIKVEEVNEEINNDFVSSNVTKETTEQTEAIKEEIDQNDSEINANDFTTEENTKDVEEDLSSLLEEYKIEYKKMVDKKMIQLIEEDMPLEKIVELKKTVEGTARLLTIKENPKFEILLERGLI